MGYPQASLPQHPMNLDQWLDHQQQQHPDAIALGLDRVREVARRLGIARPATRVVTVAGTNGKGSTVAFIEAIARGAGLRVGAYTSPHLLRYNERIRIDGIDVDDAALILAFERIEAARTNTPCVSSNVTAAWPIALTYFEFGTLAALLLMQEEKLDLAILEVGLGGRLDAVNIIDADVAMITTVDLDHQDWLGNDREAIGVEKAGVMRSGKPVVLGENDPPASVLRHAYRIGAKAIRAGCDYLVESAPDGWRWRDPGRIIELPEPVIAAPVQRANAAAAIAALRALEADGMPVISDTAIAQGVASARIPARMQRFTIAVADGEAEAIIDVAHNPQAAQELARALAAQPTSGATDAIFSGLGDKDLPGVVGALAAQVRHWFLFGLDTETDRGLSAAQLRQRLGKTLVDTQITQCSDVTDALACAKHRLRDGDRLLVFGSFFTAAAALRLLDPAR